MSLNSYTSFAKVYDTFMDNIPYEEWSEYLISLLQEYGVSDGLLLELGCGTGSITQLLHKRGYDMIGLDISSEMLDIAAEKSQESSGEILDEGSLNREILYLNQDMCSFELYGTVRGIVSVCDSMNYILEREELLDVFRLVNNYLDPGGIFIFDLNTKYKYEELLGEQVIAENREECSFIWENYYDDEECINEYDLTLFVKDIKSGYYEKFSEQHYQKAYELVDVKELLEEANLEVVAVYDAFTREVVTDTSERVYFVAREQSK